MQAQLQYEVDQLRSQLKDNPQPANNALAADAWAQDDPAHEMPAFLALHPEEEHGESSQSSNLGATQSLVELYLVSHEKHFRYAAETDKKEQASDSTDYGGFGSSDRTLRDFRLEGRKIDDCYTLFKTKYAVYLEGLFEEIPVPDEVYVQSPLLFWAIICVGSRRYKKDHTIHIRLGSLVVEIAFASIGSPCRPLPTILAAIIICNWPPPVDLVFKDPCPALAGAALNLAIQNGLHMHRREQDFVNKSRRKSSYTAPSPSADRLPFVLGIGDAAVMYRIRVWSHCVITFQSTNLCEGLPPLAVPYYREDERCKMLRSVLPDGLAYRVRMHRVQVEGIHTVANGLDPESNTTDTILSTTIHTFDERLKENYHQTGNNYQYLVQASAKLWTLAMLFITTVNDNGVHMLHLYRIARDLVVHVSNQEQNSADFASCLPHYFSRTIFTAAHCILRICKSPLKQLLDLHEAEITFFTAVDLLKKTSVLTNDLDARNSVMLPQLWSSNRVFVRTNGVQNGLFMDLRDRLGASAAFDNFWWWKAYFGNPRVSEEIVEDLNTSKEVLETTEDLNLRMNNQVQTSMRTLENDGQHSAAGIALSEDALQSLMNWDPMTMNDLLPWADWPTSGFDYGSLENIANMSTENVPAEYQTT